MFQLFIHLFVALVVIADPFGNILTFLSLTPEANSAQRRKIVSKAILFATLILVVFALGGKYILDYLNLSLASLEVAGGLLLLIISFELIFGFRKVAEKEDSIVLTPLATPLIAGPGAIVTVMIYTSQAPGTWKLLILGGIFLAMFLCWFILSNSEYLLKVLKKEGAKALAKIMGLILAALAVEMAASGIKSLIS